MSNIYRYQLDRYRGRSTRYVCPQCHRKGTFTRYIDTYNNIYISENVGKCNRIDKCGYHYTPKQYYTDNPWKRDTALVEGGSLRPCGYHYTPKQYYTDNPWKREALSVQKFKNDRVFERLNTKHPRPIDTIPFSFHLVDRRFPQSLRSFAVTGRRNDLSMPPYHITPPTSRVLK